MPHATHTVKNKTAVSPYHLCVYILISAAIALRVYWWLCDPILRLDEQLLVENIVTKSFAQLAGPLELYQGAPLGFLYIIKTSTLLFGIERWVVRLWPFTAALASIPCFYLVCTEFLTRRETLLALALFTLSSSLNYFAIDAKPYSTDVLIAIVLVWMGIQYYTGRISFLLYTLVSSSALWISFPAIFIITGSLPAMLYAKKRSHHTPSLLIGIIIIACSFAVQYLIVLRPILLNADIQNFWRCMFVPYSGHANSFAWLLHTTETIVAHHIGAPLSLMLVILMCEYGMFRAYKNDVHSSNLIAGILLVTLSAYGVRLYPLTEIRMSLFLLPFLCMIMAKGLLGGDFLTPILRNTVHSALAGILLFTPCATIAHGNIAALTGGSQTKCPARDIRRATEFFNTTARDSYISFYDPIGSWEYTQHPTTTLPYLDLYTYTENTHNKKYVWVVSDTTFPSRVTAFSPIESHTFGAVRVYKCPLQNSSQSSV